MGSDRFRTRARAPRAWLLCCVTALAACASERPPRPGGPWQHDLDVLLHELHRSHPDPYGRVGRAAFEERAEAVRERLPELDSRAAAAALLEVIALVGDSHTRLRDWSLLEDPHFPLSFSAYADGIFVVAVPYSLREAFGCQVLAIDDQPVERVFDRLRAVVPHENNVILRRSAARVMGFASVMAAVGAVRDPERARFTLSKPDGEVLELELEPLTGPTSWVWFSPQNYVPPVVTAQPRVPYWWRWLPVERVLYVQYNQCREDPERPFEDFADEILRRIDAGGVERVVIDLRFNGGGDSSVFGPLLRGLRRRSAVNRADRLVVLIGAGTYSSGMLNALQLRRESCARLVGEPTAQKPNAFGEIECFELPHSGLQIDLSTKRFQLVDGDPPSLEPDVLIPHRFRDEVVGRDLALEWALDLSN